MLGYFCVSRNLYDVNGMKRSYYDDVLRHENFCSLGVKIGMRREHDVVGG